MSLLPGQVKVELDTLYELEQTTNNNFAQNGSNIWINNGSINIYLSNSTIQPTSTSTMTLEDQDTAINGARALERPLRWVAFKQNTGTSTEINLNGIKIKQEINKGVFA